VTAQSALSKLSIPAGVSWPCYQHLPLICAGDHPDPRLTDQFSPKPARFRVLATRPHRKSISGKYFSVPRHASRFGILTLGMPLGKGSSSEWIIEPSLRDDREKSRHFCISRVSPHSVSLRVRRINTRVYKCNRSGIISGTAGARPTIDCRESEEERRERERERERAQMHTNEDNINRI